MTLLLNEEILHPVTQIGDIYELNDHRLICGDSTDSEVVKALLLHKKPILMVTDPPYGVNYDANWRRKHLKDNAKRATGKVSNDNEIDWTKAWNLFPGEIAYVWHSGRFSSQVQLTLEHCDFEIISQIIWAKQHFALSRGDYHWQHESCWYVVRSGSKHNWQGSRKESTLWKIANLNAVGKNQEDERTFHSTQKPLECMARPICNNTAPGEEVYDPFLGSGTTLIASESLGRICYGCEIDPAYCDLTVNRWAQHMRKNEKLFSCKKNGENFLL